MTDIISAETHFLDTSGEIKKIPDCILKRRFEKPLCSIVITNYNYGKYLPEAVNSALNQTIDSIEVIIVDDGSTDTDTQAVVRTFIGMPKVQVLFEHNSKLPAARNAGIGLARGKYICCLDADDILPPSYMEHCIFELESHENIGFVYTWVQFFGDKNFIWQTQNFNIAVSTQVNMTCGAAVFRRADWALVSGYDSSMTKGFEDWEFWMRLGQLGRCGKVVPAPLFFYRQHGITMCHGSEAMRADLMADIRASNARLYDDLNWLSNVKKYSSNISQSHFPSKLAAIASPQFNKSDKKSLLIILPWAQLGESENLLLTILKTMSSQYNLTIVTTCTNFFPLASFFSSLTNDIFHYANSTPGDKNHFTHFISYLVKTRHIETIITSECIHFYESIEAIIETYKNTGIIDFIHNPQSPYFNISPSKKNYITQYFCTTEQIKEILMSNNVQPEKIAVIAHERESA